MTKIALTMTKIVAINVRNDRSTRTHALTAILQELQFEMMKVNVRLLSMAILAAATYCWRKYFDAETANRVCRGYFG